MKKIFNLYECETFLSKFSSDIEVESGTRIFSAFEVSDKGTSNVFITSPIYISPNIGTNPDTTNPNTKITNYDQTGSGINSKSSSSKQKNDSNSIKDAYWEEMEIKVSKEEFATPLRKNISFLEKLLSTFRNLINSDNEKNIQSSDKKLTGQLVRVLFSILTKVNITKNQDILKDAMTIFMFAQQEEDQQMLNDIIKVIGLFAKFYCYYSNEVDLSFCATFIKHVPSIINSTIKPTNVHINVIRAVGIMITAANMFPKRSLMFYRAFHDCSLVSLVFICNKNLQECF